MEHFAIGVVSLAFAALFPILYFMGFQVRRLSAWSKRENGPKDRIGFFLVAVAIIGFGVGSFAQPFWNKANECKAVGQPVLSCVFIFK